MVAPARKSTRLTVAPPLAELAQPDKGKEEAALYAAQGNVAVLSRSAPHAPTTHFLRGALAAAVAALPFHEKSRFLGVGGADASEGDAAEAFAAARAAAGRGREPLAIAVRRAHALLRVDRVKDAEEALSEWVKALPEAGGGGGGGGGGGAEEAAAGGLALPMRDYLARAEARVVAQALHEKLPRLAPGCFDAAWAE
jgi:hypothetical protein